MLDVQCSTERSTTDDNSSDFFVWYLFFEHFYPYHQDVIRSSLLVLQIERLEALVKLFTL